MERRKRPPLVPKNEISPRNDLTDPATGEVEIEERIETLKNRIKIELQNAHIDELAIARLLEIIHQRNQVALQKFLSELPNHGGEHTASKDALVFWIGEISELEDGLEEIKSTVQS